MMHDNQVSTVQTQQQKTTVRGNVQGSVIVQLLWSGVALLSLVSTLWFLVWVRGDTTARILDGLVLGIILLGAGYFGWHIGWREHYKTKQAEYSTHFYAHGESIIGDSTTHPYRHFHPTFEGNVKDEPLSIPQPPDSWEQQNDRSIWTMHEIEKKTWNDIVAQFDEGLGMTIQKCRTASQRHQGRITRGETYQ